MLDPTNDTVLLDFLMQVGLIPTSNQRRFSYGAIRKQKGCKTALDLYKKSEWNEMQQR